MKLTVRKIVTTLVIIIIIAFVWQVASRIKERGDGNGPGGRKGPRSVPVEVAKISVGPIELRKTFSGTL